MTLCASSYVTPPTDTDSPSLKGPTVVLPLMKVTVVAGESVEMQVIVDGDPGVNSGGSLTVGPAGGRKSSITSQTTSQIPYNRDNRHPYKTKHPMNISTQLDYNNHIPIISTRT